MYGGRGVVVTLEFVELSSRVQIPSASPIIMGDLLNRRVSTITGILVILFVIAVVGSFVFSEFQSFMQMRFESLE